MTTIIEETDTIIEAPKVHELEAGSEPAGEILVMVLGPKFGMSSGLGGLGLEGIMGSDASLGEISPLLGVGNKGVISGDKAGVGEDNGGNGNEDIVLVANDNWYEGRHKRHKAISGISVGSAIC